GDREAARVGAVERTRRLDDRRRPAQHGFTRGPITFGWWGRHPVTITLTGFRVQGSGFFGSGSLVLVWLFGSGLVLRFWFGSGYWFSFAGVAKEPTNQVKVRT